MKLKMHSFDFEQCTLSFSVPAEIVRTQSFGNVPIGVEVDLGAITGNAALGIKELADTATNKQSTPLPACITCAVPNCGMKAGYCGLYKPQ